MRVLRRLHPSLSNAQFFLNDFFFNDLLRRHAPPSVRRSSGRLNPLGDENRMGLISAKGNNKFIFRNSMAYKKNLSGITVSTKWLSVPEIPLPLMKVTWPCNVSGRKGLIKLREGWAGNTGGCWFHSQWWNDGGNALIPGLSGGRAGHLIRSCGDETIRMTHMPVLLLGGFESCKSTSYNRGVKFCL